MWPLIVLAVLALCSLVLVFLMLRRCRLSPTARRQLEEAWKHVTLIPDPVRQVLEAEKVVDRALTVLGFGGTFGEKLQKAGPRLSDREAIWRAHKLRNRIAHEVGISVGAADAGRAVSAFHRALKDLY